MVVKLQCGHWKLNQEKSCSLLTAEPPLQIVFSFKSPVSHKLLNICNRDKGPESGSRFTGGARQPGHHQAALLHWLLHHSGPPSCVHHHHLKSPAELVLDMTRKLQSSALILSETLCSFIPCPLVLVIKWASDVSKVLSCSGQHNVSRKVEDHRNLPSVAKAPMTHNSQGLAKVEVESQGS